MLSKDDVRRMRRHLQEENHCQSAELREIAVAEWPMQLQGKPQLMRVLRSRTHLVQVYIAPESQTRLSMIRSKVNDDGTWQEITSWEELQRLKREAGYAQVCAVEIYPPDADIINEANMRHLWLVHPPAFMWRASHAPA